MSTTTPERPAVRERGRWSLSWHGVSTVMRLELRQRVRSTKWYVGLAVFFAVVGLVTVLTTLTVGSEAALGDVFAGRLIFDVVVFFVLLLGLLVAPTLSSSSVNGDSKAGVLAILQVTLLTPAEIAVGKLLASWLSALAFLAVSLPFLAWGVVKGSLSLGAVLVTIVLLAFVLAVVVALGLGFSSLVPRTSSSAVLTYLGVASLSVISAIVFGLSLALTVDEEPVRVWGVPAEVGMTVDWGSGQEPRCSWFESVERVPHTERTWWLLAVNPFVVVADAMPDDAQREDPWYDEPAGIMSLIRYGVREARMGPALEVNRCWLDPTPESSPVPPRDADRSPVWPWGIAVHTLLGAGALALTVRRLSIPVERLPRGVRVA